MLGYEYVVVGVHTVSDIGDENLPRPYESLRTVRDAIGCVVAWPRSRVSSIPHWSIVHYNYLFFS